MLGPKLDDDVALLAVPDQPGRGASGSRDVACLLAERLNKSKDRSLEVIAMAGRAISLLFASSHLRQPLENLALKAIVGLALRLDDLEQFPTHACEGGVLLVERELTADLLLRLLDPANEPREG